MLVSYFSFLISVEDADAIHLVSPPVLLRQPTLLLTDIFIVFFKSQQFIVMLDRLLEHAFHSRCLPMSDSFIGSSHCFRMTCCIVVRVLIITDFTSIHSMLSWFFIFKLMIE